jgi:hypothetical protein
MLSEKMHDYNWSLDMNDPAKYWYEVSKYWYNVSILQQRHTRPPDAGGRGVDAHQPPTTTKPKRRRPPEPVTDYRLLESIRSFSDLAALESRLGTGGPADVQRLVRLAPIAKELDTMVGMQDTKDTLFKMLIYQLQQTLTSKRRRSAADGMLHMCITGEPGTGKTSLAGIIGRLFAACGTLERGHVVVAKRSDFVGKYVGHTAPRTLEVLNSAVGGVLVIDEVYSLGAPGVTDVFAKEAVDTINEFLSQHAHDILVVVAGYKHEIASSFFAQNKGLARRFPIVVNLDKPSADDMYTIFDCMAHRCEMQVDPSAVGKARAFVKRHYAEFVNNAGDMETLLTHTKFETAVRTWYDRQTTPCITLADLTAGYERMISNRCTPSRQSCVVDMYT